MAETFPLLNDAVYLQSLSGIFYEYQNDLQDILEFATVENNGRRLDNIENEIYSLFHHISRSLTKSTPDEALEELKKSRSHLRRAVLDSYKVTVGTIIEKSSSVIHNLQVLQLDEDFRACTENVSKDYNKIRGLIKQVKKLFLEAKKCERAGNYETAVQNYNEALDAENTLDELIEKFESNNAYLLALSRLKKKDLEKKAQKRFTIWTIIISCVLTALLSFTVQYFLYKITAKQKQSATQEISIQHTIPGNQ